MTDLSQLLDQFGCDEEEKVLFSSLFTHGEQKVQELAKNSSIKRTTIYGVIERLLDKNLIEEITKQSVKTYRVLEKENIKKNLDTKISTLWETKSSIDKLFSSLNTGANKKPELKFFEGKSGVQHVLNDLILYKNTETESFWPIKKMLKVLGADYFNFLNKERIKRNIFTRAIWPENQIIDTKEFPYLGSGEEFLREIRVAPKQIDFSVGYWIYEDKVAFIACDNEPYAFILKSEIFVEMMKMQWNLVWNLSKPLKQEQNKETKKFIENI